MKYLKRFNESGNASFDWLRVQKNEAYFELIEILKGELFDDYDISPQKNEEFTDFEDGSDDWPTSTNQFWSYCVNFPGLQHFTSRQEEVEDKEIDKIVVYNILHKDYPEFKQRLINLKERSQDFIGREIILGEESIYSNWVDLGAPDVPETDYWDFIIKIGEII